MDTDDWLPKKAAPKPKDLSAMGIEELEEYRGELEAEIVRINETIEAKKAHRQGLDGLFKS